MLGLGKTKYRLTIDEDSFDLIIYALIEWKNKLIREERYTDAIDDEKGALIYDYYTLDEIKGEGNAGLKLADSIDFRIYRDSAVINLGTVTNDVIKISTTAVDSKTKSHTANIDKSITIIDTVKYQNFTKGKKYKMVGTLMDKVTGKPLLVNRKTVTSEQEFTANDENGTVDVRFTFDGTSFGGKSVIVFEKAYEVETGTEICSHEDIDDNGQTVTIKEPKKPDAPKTGDDGNMLLWFGLAVLSIVLSSGLIMNGLCRSKEDKDDM